MSLYASHSEGRSGKTIAMGLFGGFCEIEVETPYLRKIILWSSPNRPMNTAN